MTEDVDRRDEVILEALKTEGFCLAFLHPVGLPADARPDFTMFLPSLDGPNLVVAGPSLTRQAIEQTIEKLPQRQFADGQTIQVVDKFNPTPGNWFRFQTEIVYVADVVADPLYVADVVADPPYFRGDLDRGPWAHCADLSIRRAGTESRLRVIHAGLGRNSVFLHFLLPHGLVPRRLLL